MSNSADLPPKWTNIPGCCAIFFGFAHHEIWVLLGIYILAYAIGKTLKNQVGKVFLVIAGLSFVGFTADMLVRIVLWLQKLTA